MATEKWAKLMRRTRRSPGFTLIEILIALTVFAITSSALISGLSRHVAQSAVLRDKIIAHWVAENEISQIRNPAFESAQASAGQSREKRYFPGTGTSSKEVTMGDLKWYARIQVAATENPDIHRVTVDVYHAEDEADGNSTVTVDGFVGKY